MDSLINRLISKKFDEIEPPVNRETAQLHLQYIECVDKKQNTVLYGVSLVTAPWSYHIKSISPFIISMIVGILPDYLYAKFSCEDQYLNYVEKVKAAKESMEQNK